MQKFLLSLPLKNILKVVFGRFNLKNALDMYNLSYKGAKNQSA